MKLDVRHTWDGQDIPAPEQASLTLSLEERGLVIEVDAPWHGDAPPDAPPGPTWALWEHEVVELFVLGPAEVYTELELGPHGHHLLLRLAGRRNIVQRELPLDFRVRRAGERWTGRALIPLEMLPPRPWRVNAVAIHGQGEQRRYLAWAPMPGDGPDFHRLEYYRSAEL